MGVAVILLLGVSVSAAPPRYKKGETLNYKVRKYLCVVDDKPEFQFGTWWYTVRLDVGRKFKDVKEKNLHPEYRAPKNSQPMIKGLPPLRIPFRRRLMDRL